MAENEVKNDIEQAGIVINNLNNYGMNKAVLSVLVEYFKQSNIDSKELKTLLANLESLATTDDIKTLNEDMLKRYRRSLYYARNTIVDKFEELSVKFAYNQVYTAQVLSIVLDIDNYIHNMFGEIPEKIEEIEGVAVKKIRSSMRYYGEMYSKQVIEEVKKIDPTKNYEELTSIISDLSNSMADIYDDMNDNFGIISDEVRESKQEILNKFDQSKKEMFDKVEDKLKELKSSSNSEIKTYLDQTLNNNFTSLVNTFKESYENQNKDSSEKLEFISQSLFDQDKKLDQLLENLNEQREENRENNLKTIENQEEILKYLKTIVENLAENNKKQDEILLTINDTTNITNIIKNIITETLNTSLEGKTVDDSKLKDIVDKLNDIFEKVKDSGQPVDHTEIVNQITNNVSAMLSEVAANVNINQIVEQITNNIITNLTENKNITIIINEDKKKGKEEPPVKPELIEDHQPKPKYKKLNFIQKSLQTTKILAEPKQPWYKRLATFAIKHPIIAVLVGSGIGLGAFGISCGIAAVAGGTGILTAANMMLPSIPGFAGIGAIGGGAASVVSNTLPKGKWGLVAKANRQFEKVKRIDKTKQWVAKVEETQKLAKQESREKHRNSKGLIRKLKVHRIVSKTHKLIERTARRVGRLFGRKLEKTATKALKTKSDLNIKEIQSGKTEAIAGYLQKKRNAEEKYLRGKISEEELEERLEDYEEDVSDLDGGAPGLKEVGDQYTFDKEALDVIDIVDSKGKNSEFQMLKNTILQRNSVVADRSIKTRVVLDPEYLEELIKEMKEKGETEKIAEYEEYLATIKAQMKETQNYAKEHGINIDPLQDLTDEEIAKIEKENLEK